MDFRDYLRRKVLKKSDRILEFGPLTRPTVNKKTHPNIKFADVRSTEDIKKLYTSNDYLESTGIKVDLNSIVEIDHVINGSYKQSFKGIEKFDAVILSHVIEHMPDILFFFKDIENVLKSEGKLVLIYPDARYCFDHFRNGTTFIDAYDVYNDSENSSKRVFDFVFNVVHENDPHLFWGDENQNSLLPTNSFKESLIAYEKAKKNVLPDDTHFWPFADYQFAKFLYDMERAGFSSLQIEEFYQTEPNTQEFMVVLSLKKNKLINTTKYSRILKKVSPSNKEIIKSNKIAALIQDNESIKIEKATLKNELDAIYASKTWKYAQKASTIKNKLKRTNG